MIRIVRLSSKGQIVIPQEVREKLELKEGDNFIVIPISNDIIVLKKIFFNDEHYKAFTKELSEALKSLGVEIDEKILDKAFKIIINKYGSNKA